MPKTTTTTKDGDLGLIDITGKEQVIRVDLKGFLALPRGIAKFADITFESAGKRKGPKKLNPIIRLYNDKEESGNLEHYIRLREDISPNFEAVVQIRTPLKFLFNAEGMEIANAVLVENTKVTTFFTEGGGVLFHFTSTLFGSFEEYVPGERFEPIR